MKYDVIVIGAGPAGLMAAKTAAEDGLKVLLVERQKDVTEINRLCGQFTNINLISVSGKYKYAYSEPLNLEVGTDKTRVHFPALGFSIDYNGPLRPYYNYIYFSPSGYKIYREKDRFFGFFWEKESLLAGLLTSAEKAGAEVLTETMALGAENTSDGVKVLVRTKWGDKTVEARKVIDAEGHGSRIVDSLHLREKRQLGSARPAMRWIGYVLEGVETEFRLNTLALFNIPSLVRSDFWMFTVAGDRNILGTSASAVGAIERFMKLPFFEPWFRHARIVKKVARGIAGFAPIPLKEPVAGNVLILGEATGLAETSNPGAIACGYQGAKATLKELNGQKGYPEYIDWWQKSFEGNDPNYYKAVVRYGMLTILCSDEEIDYLYHLFQDRIGVPGILVAQNLELVKDERPELYEKIKKTGVDKGLDALKLDWFQFGE